MPYRKEFKDTLYSKEWLYRVYVEEDRNAAQVAELIGVTNGAVLDNLRKFDIPIKDASEAQKLAPIHGGSNAPRPRAKFKDTLHNEEWVHARSHLNASELAHEAGCSVASAQVAMRKFGMNVPGISEAKAGRPQLDKRKENQVVTRATSSRRASVACLVSPCVLCGTTEKTQVNHIDYNWQNNDPSNLERLCPPCHALQHKAEAKEMRLMLEDLGIPYLVVWEKARAKIKGGEYTRNKQGLGFLDVEGLSQSYAKWSQVSGIPEGTIRRRIEKGWDPKRAVSEPVPEREKHLFEGISDTIAGHARRKGLHVGNVYSRIHQGWSVERALSTPILPTKR